MRNRLYGGVRGRKTKVGRKLLRFPPTRLKLLAFKVSWILYRSYLVSYTHQHNRVGGKRSSFLPTFVFRPLTPPYVPFGIRRFFTMDAFRILRKTLPRHLLQPSICRSALLYTLRIPSYLFKGSPILLFWFYAFVPTNGSFQLCRLNKVWSFPIGIHALGTTTSADFSRQALLHHGTSNHSSSPYVRETSSDKGINFQSYVCSIYTNRPE